MLSNLKRRRAGFHKAQKTMNYANLKLYDVANGPGVRISLFVSGCTRGCLECFNKEAWDFNYGEPFTEEIIDEIITYLAPDYVEGLTILGGEPFEHSNQQGILPLLKKVRGAYPEKSIWCFSGYDFEEDIMGRMYKEWPETKEVLSYIDVLVDGRFIVELKDLTLKFKGSSNQRTIMVQDTLKSGELTLWDGVRSK